MPELNDKCMFENLNLTQTYVREIIKAELRDINLYYEKLMKQLLMEQFNWTVTDYSNTYLKTKESDYAVEANNYVLTYDMNKELV